MTTETPHIHKGLAGVVVDTTAISKVVPETNSLTYRGYPVQELAATVIRAPGADGRRAEAGHRYRVPRGTRIEIGDQFFVVS